MTVWLLCKRHACMCDRDSVSTDVRKSSCPVILPCTSRGIMSFYSVKSDLSPAWEDEEKSASPRVCSIVMSIMLETLPLVSHWMEQSNNNGWKTWQVTFIKSKTWVNTGVGVHDCRQLSAGMRSSLMLSLQCFLHTSKWTAVNVNFVTISQNGS